MNKTSKHILYAIVLCVMVLLSGCDHDDPPVEERHDCLTTLYRGEDGLFHGERTCF